MHMSSDPAEKLLLDIFGNQQEPDPFPVHEVTIFEAWVSDEGDEVDYDYNLIHPDGCGGDECLVGMTFMEGGQLHEVLCGYPWPREVQTYPWKTTYYVRGWVRHYPANPNHADEWDQGVYVGLKKEDV